MWLQVAGEGMARYDAISIVWFTVVDALMVAYSGQYPNIYLSWIVGFIWVPRQPGK